MPAATATINVPAQWQLHRIEIKPRLEEKA